VNASESSQRMQGQKVLPVRRPEGRLVRTGVFSVADIRSPPPTARNDGI
jgi:hypothetical protein